MSNPVDTSSEAVERLAGWLDEEAWVNAAATLLALLAERVAERDAALAQVAASEAKILTMIEAREAAKVPAPRLIPSDSRGWGGDFQMRTTPEIEAFKQAGCQPFNAISRVDALERRVAALEERLRNR
jgi:hypothetical protein